METEFGGQIVSALMVLEEKDGALRGTWHSMGAEMELRELRLEGNRLHFVRTMGLGGPAMTFEGAIDGDAIEGAFDFEGQELPCTGRRSK